MKSDKRNIDRARHSQANPEAAIDQYFRELAAQPSRVSRDAPRAGLAQLLACHGNPQDRLRVVRVVGSKGKGSTALILEAILASAGLRVGTFTSPHIEHWCERIRLLGQPVAATELAGVLDELAPEVAGLRATGLRGPDFFEVCLAAALLLFARHDLDLVIVEAGIGAATDATAIARAELAILTTVEAEHLDVIGPELVDVAREKATAIEPGRPIVTGRLPRVAADEVARQVAACHAPHTLLGRDIHVTRALDGDDSRLHYREAGHDWVLGVPATLYWFADNAALAIAAARRLTRETLDPAVVERGLGVVRLPARLERLGDAPLLIADSAHTEASSLILAQYLSRCAQKPRILVLAFSATHGPGALSSRLWPQIDHVIVTCADSSRGRAAKDVAREVGELTGTMATIEPEPMMALAQAVEMAGADGLVCAAGSVYLAVHAKRFGRTRF